MQGNSRPRKQGEVGASNKTKSGEGEEWETYITMKICHWLYTRGCMEMGGELGLSLLWFKGRYHMLEI